MIASTHRHTLSRAWEILLGIMTIPWNFMWWEIKREPENKGGWQVT